jgi:hypothetical protein
MAQDLGAQTPGGQDSGTSAAQPLRVLIRTSPETPLSGSLWTVALLVDHPIPSEVQVRLPPLPPSLNLERIRSEPRLVPGYNGENERWTAVEYQFSLNSAGRIALGPFEIVLPGASTRTSPLTLTVRGSSEPVFRPQLSWQNPSTLRIGESAELLLTLSGWDPRRAIPDPQPFLPKTPPGAILDLVAQAAGSSSSTAAASPAADEGQVVILHLNIIPLEGNLFTLPQARVAFEGLNLNVPALRIPVMAAVTDSNAAAFSAAYPDERAGLKDAGGRFFAPEIEDFPPKAGFFLFRSAYEGIRKRVEALWTDGRRVEALAELRQNERDHFAGPVLIPLRREVERALSLEPGENEKWRPHFLLTMGLLLSLGLLIVTVIVHFFSKKTVTAKFSRGYTSVLILFVAGAGICLWELGDSAGRLLPGSVQYALVRETEARRVPEPEGAVNVRFKEGTRVLIRQDKSRWESGSGRLNWAYVESAAGSSADSTGAGWVRTEDIIVY